RRGGRNGRLLRGLTPECITRLAQAELGKPPDRRLLDACLRRSEGNPLFLLELVQWLAGRQSHDELPDGIRQVIGRRLAQLGDECLRALEVAAVAGGEVALPVLARGARGAQGAPLPQPAPAERPPLLTQPPRPPG